MIVDISDSGNSPGLELSSVFHRTISTQVPTFLSLAENYPVRLQKRQSLPSPHQPVRNRPCELRAFVAFHESTSNRWALVAAWGRELQTSTRQDWHATCIGKNCLKRRVRNARALVGETNQLKRCGYAMPRSVSVVFFNVLHGFA